ncbi:MAG: AMP-binding protein, partial [Actinocatenispora sp.]
IAGAGPLALVQLTSGSQGAPRAVRIGWPALTANVAGIVDWLHMGQSDAVASWLPLHHDMGLVGILLTSVARQVDLRLMAPEEFLGRPLRYLREFGAGSATLTAMPAFGLRHVLRRVRPESLTGLDFRGWRGLIVGAERIDAGVLDAFTDLLASHGFRRHALLPAYGLAEATVAATGCPLSAEPVVRHLDAAGLGDEVREAPASDGRTVAAVGCGGPLPGVRLALVDGAGDDVADGRLGEIVVGGTSVADGYTDAGTGSHTRIADGRVYTGDAGVRIDGELFVLGRMGDGVKVRGRALFAESLEAALTDAGVPAERLAVLLGEDRGVPTAVVLVERPDPAVREAVRAALLPLLPDVRLVTVEAPARTIARTSSGKPRRHELWRRFRAGLLPVAGTPEPTVPAG